ncbi:MAG TPA: FAD-dependent oxidoreductase [Pseudonocardiaceae bacterium]|nr:FAD-dependent oxidoreductase [Pseudonocardiaceae bacterium]
MDDDVLVVGAGVIGLTTAVCLAEAGWRVRIRTAASPADTTSAAAGAMWGRGPGVQEPADRIAAWTQVTLTDLTALADDPASGVRFARGREVTRSGPAPTPLPGTRDTAPCTSADLPPGFVDGHWITVPLVDMPRYLSYLLDRFARARGTLELRPVTALTGAPIVVNCSGAAARELVPDPDVRAVRGQHVLVANPGLTEFFVEETDADSWVNFFPHGDRVVLGGVAVDGDWDLTPDPATAAAIIERCSAVEPRLKNADVLGHLVGLRPVRTAVRLTDEHVDGIRVLHNYGHGGMGVTLSWGCAREIAALVGRS